jgi:hypothetical protein
LRGVPLINQLILPTLFVGNLIDPVPDNLKCLSHLVIFHVFFIIQFVSELKELIYFLLLCVLLHFFSHCPCRLVALFLLVLFLLLTLSRHLFMLRQVFSRQRLWLGLCLGLRYLNWWVSFLVTSLRCGMSLSNRLDAFFQIIQSLLARLQLLNFFALFLRNLFEPGHRIFLVIFRLQLGFFFDLLL